MRCVPHDEDTGGFFVATLRKINPVMKLNPPIYPPLSTNTPCENLSFDTGIGIEQDVLKSEEEEEVFVNATVTEPMNISTNDLIDDIDNINNTNTIQTDVKKSCTNTNTKPNQNSNKGLMELKVWDEISFKKVFEILKYLSSNSFIC